MDALTDVIVSTAIESGDRDLCLEIGRKLFRGDGIDEDWISARRCLETLTDDPEAMVMLGQIYQLGIGVKCNNAKIFSLYKKSADMGNAEAMFRLGRMYMTGTYVRKNELLAHKLMNESISKGYTPCEHHKSEPMFDNKRIEKRRLNI